MPTKLDFAAAKMKAYKDALQNKSPKEREGRVSVQMATQFNAALEEMRKELSEIAIHLPQPIDCTSIDVQVTQISTVKFIELEMMVNQVIEVLRVAQSDH